MSDVLNPKLAQVSNRGLQDQTKRLSAQVNALPAQVNALSAQVNALSAQLNALSAQVSVLQSWCASFTYEQFLEKAGSGYSTNNTFYVVKVDPHFTQTPSLVSFKMIYRARVDAGYGYVKMEYNGDEVESEQITNTSYEWFELTLTPSESVQVRDKLQVYIKVDNAANTFTLSFPCFYAIVAHIG